MPTGLVRIATLLVIGSCVRLFAQPSVLTQHNDLSRTGQNLSETILTPASVTSGNFGKRFSLAVDGVVMAQPLYVPNLKVGSVTQNVLFVATEHDSVFAFNADTGGNALWQASLLDSVHGASPGAIPDPDSDSGCYVSNGEWGITGTPVIDPVTATLYVVSLSYENSYPVQRLHALDITTGAEKFAGPVVISASLSGTGSGSSNGQLNFDPRWQLQRPGLLLVNSTVYVGFGSHCDLGPFHGWMLAYNATTLAQTAAFLTSPNGVDSAIWMGAAAPAVDVVTGVTRMFLTTGNGSYDATDYGDDILRLDLSGGLNVVDAFTPFNQATLQSTDADLGSSGALILPDQPGAYPHLLVEASKGGAIYLVNRDNLGGYSTSGNNVVQEIDGQAVSSFGLPAYWNGNIYLWPAVDHLKQFSLTNGLLSATPVASSSQMTTATYGVGSTPSISANGTTNAIVWTIDSSQSTQVLYAHDATNVANTLWSSAANATTDSAGQATKFSVPTVVNGKVYVGSNSEVVVYGLLDFSLSSTSSTIMLAVGGMATDTINIVGQTGFTGTVSLSASNLPAGVTAAFASSTATFTAARNATPGSYPVTITGVSGTLSHSLIVSLVVPGFSITPSPTSLSLAAGTSSTTKITVNPIQGFAGNVTFTCSVASSLANVTCSIPGTVNGGTGSATLTVTVGSGAVITHFRRKPPIEIICLLAGLFLAGCAYFMKGPTKIRKRAVAFTLLLMVGLAGCGGGGSSVTTSVTSSTAETGLITVVATSGSLANSITVSVTIQ